MQEAQPKSDTQAVHPPTYHDNADTLDLVALPKMVRHRQRRRLIVISISLSLLIVASVVFAALHTNGAVTTYQTVTVTQGNFLLTALATGSVQAGTYEADFSSSGTIAAIYVQVGQQVQTGQKLAQLDTTMLKDQLQAAQVQLQQADNSGNGAAIQIAQAQVNLAQDDLNAATLTAPHAGVITAINGTVGGRPGSGSASSGASGFIEIIDLSALSVLVNVNEADMEHVALGDLVQFTVDAYGNRTFTGVVSAITQNGQTNNSIVTYPVLVSVDASSVQGAHLLPGMITEATIITLTRQQVLLIPNNAVSFAQGAVSQGLIQESQIRAAQTAANQMLASLIQSRGVSIWQDNPNASYVVEQRHGQLVVVPVILGLTDGKFYEVLSGLNAHDLVINGVTTGPSPNSSGQQKQQQQGHPSNSHS